MGKFTEISRRFPPADDRPEIAASRERINAIKDQLRVGGVLDPIPEAPPRAVLALVAASGSLASALADLRRQKSDHETKEKEINARIKAVEELLWSSFEATGAAGVRLESGEYFGVTDDLSVSTTNRDEVNAWIREQKLERLLAVNANTLSQLVKERVLAGLDIPPGVEIKSYKKTTFGKSSA